jgi:O-antigen biosynthesis protein
MDRSIAVPVADEKQNLAALLKELLPESERGNSDYEVLFARLAAADASPRRLDAAGGRLGRMLGDGSRQAARLSPCDFPLCWTFPGRLRGRLPSAWIEHIPFAFALVEMLRPRCVVELGVQSGDSFLAFCQAVKTLELEARCYGVDHWQGDGHTGAYGLEVLQELRDYHEPRYGAFSQLVQATFDEAVNGFPDGGIDLLHIDGWHTYEAVCHDFQTWQPKLSPRAVVLFHDTNVRARDFGVWRMWQELSAAYPHFEFTHGNGLGVLVVGNEAPATALALAGVRGPDAEAVRNFYFTLGHRLSLAVELDELRPANIQAQRDLAACREELARQQARLALIEGSQVWRLRQFLHSLPVVKQAARWMTRRGAAV